jgi:hypothetical protein
MKVTLAFTAAVVLAAVGLSAQTSSKIGPVDHKLTKSIVFVHGAGTPAEVAFDVGGTKSGVLKLGVPKS